MCFSAEADAVTGVFVVAVGVDVLRHVGGRRDHLLLASIPLPLSGFTHIVRWGIGNLVAVVVLAVLTIGGFVSLWCAYAALSAGAIAKYTRYAKPPLGLITAD